MLSVFLIFLTFGFMECLISGCFNVSTLASTRTRKEVCCSNYEEKNGNCVACEYGFTSYRGGQCEPCSNRSFGHQCLYLCRCRKKYRCDNVLGCVIIDGTSQEQTSVLFTPAVEDSKNEVVIFVIRWTVLQILCAKTDMGDSYDNCVIFFINRKEYCCYSYGEDNGFCIKCKNGSESKRGGPCLPCNSRMYGENCANDCNCTNYERCDRITGNCRRKMSTTKVMSSFNIDYTKQSENIRRTTLHIQKIAHISQPITTEETHIRPSTGKEEENNDDSIEINDLGLSKRGVTVYIITIVGIIMILIILYICRHCRKKRQTPILFHNITQQNEEILEIDIFDVEGIYSLIDDNLVVDSFIPQQNIPTNPYLEVIGSLDSDSNGMNTSCESSDESNRDGASQNDSTSYLNAYQPLAENWRDKAHVYDQRSVAIITHWDQCSELNNTKGTQQVVIGLSLTKRKHQSQSSSPLCMHIQKHLESSYVLYRRKSF